MSIIYGDSGEKAKTHKAFKKRLGDQYQIKELGFWDCELEKILMYKHFVEYCANPNEVTTLQLSGFKVRPKKLKCLKCPHRKYVRCADFSNEAGSFFIERKSVSDFLSSMIAHLYTQMNKMDTYIAGNKIVLLEGTPRNKKTVMINDSKSYFSNTDKRYHDLSGLSPIEQAIKLCGKPEWVHSFIRECFMRGIMFAQTYDLEETIEYVIQADEGFGHESKYRIIPKRYPTLPLNQAILCLFKGIALKRSESILKKDQQVRRKLANLINYINKNYARK